MMSLARYFGPRDPAHQVRPGCPLRQDWPSLSGTFKVPYFRHAWRRGKPQYSLDSIKATFVSVRTLRITKTATTCAEGLGVTLEVVVAVIQGSTREHFYKSMTSAASSAIWQDVYHVPYASIVLYVSSRPTLKATS